MRSLSTGLSAITVLVVAGCLWPVGLRRDGARINVTSAAVTRGRLHGPIVHEGVVRPAATVRVEPPSPVPVRSIDVVTSAFVHAGEVLAHVDPGPLVDRLAIAQHELDAATADVAARLETCDREAREWDAFAQARDQALDAAAGQRLKESVAAANLDLQMAQQRVEQAQATQARAASDVAEAVLRAPISGWVALIDPVVPHFEIAPEVDHVEVVESVAADEAEAIRAGDAALVTSGIRQVRGTIERVEPSADGSHTIVVDVPGPMAQWPIGEAVVIAVPGDRRLSVLRVPTPALAFTPSADVLGAAEQTSLPIITLRERSVRSGRVWVYSFGSFTAIDVATGGHDDRYTEIVNGPLQPGDRIVTGASIVDDASAEGGDR